MVSGEMKARGIVCRSFKAAASPSGRRKYPGSKGRRKKHRKNSGRRVGCHHRDRTQAPFKNGWRQQNCRRMCILRARHARRKHRLQRHRYRLERLPRHLRAAARRRATRRYNQLVASMWATRRCAVDSWQQWAGLAKDRRHNGQSGRHGMAAKL